MDRAWIDGRPVGLEAACAEAARMLQQSRLPVIAGLATDVAGARAALALAQRAGAVVDHMHSAALLHVLDVVRDAGIMTTTPTEARLRADVLLLVGPLPIDALQRLLSAKPATGERTIIWLCPGRAAARGVAFAGKVQTVGRQPGELPAVLAALRATIAGRAVTRAPIAAKALANLAAQLRAARFGVALWSAVALDALTTEMLCGLIKDLNAQIRFSGLPLPPGDNALGVLQVCGWASALPPRIGFARGFAEHDPWRFDARRLVDSGEADCVVWISAYRPALPPWTRDVPTIALTAEGANFARRPRVHVTVGRPGIDHDAVEYLSAAGALAWTAAPATAATIRVSDALDRMAAAFPTRVVVPC